MQTYHTTSNIFRNNLLKITASNYSQQIKSYIIRLQEVGHLKTPMEFGNYKTGQMFLHKLFGYRGVVLFPWLARVFNRDVLKREKRYMDSDESSKEKSKKGESIQPFYNVLIDKRDIPFIRFQSEVITFFDSEENEQELIIIHGMDHVAHENLLPYTPTEHQPLQHELLNKFFSYNPESDPPFIAENNLHAWEKKNHSWLKLTKVNKETTELVRVTVIPFYMGYRGNHYWWRYSICLENLSDFAVRLRERRWSIFTDSGALETVWGTGVMDQEIILSRRNPVFQYNSHVSIDEPSGHMWGTFNMEREDGLVFNCIVPSFVLESRLGGMVPPDNVAQ